MQTTKNKSSKIVHARFAHPARNVVALGIQPGMKIADFGSGSGAYVLSMAEALCGSGHVYAVDIQRDLLRRTRNESQRRGFRNVEIVWGDLERTGGSKIADGALDMVLISNLLFQVMDKNVVIAEALRVLRPQGRVAIIDWIDSFGGTGPIEQDVVSKETALALAAKAGLELVKEFSAGAHHYGLIFRRK